MATGDTEKTIMRAQRDDLANDVETLRQTINQWNHEYYVLDQPSATDAEYDLALQELQQIEETHPEIVTVDSPTRRVGATPQSGFEKIIHPVPMLSLSNIRDETELYSWAKRLHRLLPNTDFTFVTEPKIDGLAVALTYVDGLFHHGATRGDGLIGENITPNLRTLRNMPLKLRSSTMFEPPSIIEIRGEVYMGKDDFVRLNRRLEKSGQRQFMNPRNAAAGSLRQLDSRVTADRPLRLFAYGIGFVQGGESPRHHQEALNLLREAGFNTSPDARVHSTIEEVWTRCRMWQDQRHSLDYEIDGVVVKVDDIRLQEELGSVAREPRWATAYKFPALQQRTTVRDIIINVGRTGTLNPLALLEPVNIGGVVVGRATLHNEDEIARKDIRIGDEVIVQRAGDVIPQIVSVIVEHRSGDESPFQMPDCCPECGTAVHREPGAAKRYCTNAACPAQLKQRVHHFISRRAMDIDGMGEKLADRFIDLGMIKDVSDLYALNWELIASLDGLGEKSADNLRRAVEQSKSRPLARLLFGLGIRHIGETSAALLADRFSSISALTSATLDEINAIAGVGPVLAESVYDFFQEPRNQEILQRLGDHGVRTENAPTEGTPNGGRLLLGKTIVVTGKLESLTRSAVESRLRRAGADVAGSVSKKTSFVVAGTDPGSKVDRARQLGIPIIDESSLMALLRGESDTMSSTLEMTIKDSNGA